MLQAHEEQQHLAEQLRLAQDDIRRLEQQALQAAVAAPAADVGCNSSHAPGSPSRLGVMLRGARGASSSRHSSPERGEGTASGAAASVGSVDVVEVSLDAGNREAMYCTCQNIPIYGRNKSL